MLQTSAIKIYGNGGGMLPKLNSDFRYSDLTENAIKVYDINQNGILKMEIIFCFTVFLQIFGI